MPESMQADSTPTRAARREAQRAVRRARTRRGFASATALSIAVLSSLVALPQAAIADPASLPATPTTYSAGATFSGTVPDGVCAVQATVTGGAGGRAAAGANGVGSNGAGARIIATYGALPGQTFSGIVGGGGATNNGRSGGAGGTHGGGAGGTASDQHGGAGGGGRSEFTLDGTLRILAGGGGGSGGGHSVTDRGFGGDAGIPEGAGVANGAAGTDGTDADPTYTVGGGAGGAETPGAGGVHVPNPGATNLNGLDGSGRAGGAGAADPNYDAAGGGGAGYAGGGGGASTSYRNEDLGVMIVAGGGGGGGSSFVASGAEDLAASPVGRQTGTGAGASGAVTLNWVPCDYDLAVTKTVDDATPLIGDTINWTVTVVNNGDDFMTRNDTVTIEDSLPGAGAKTITGISVTGGANTVLERGAVTCNAAVGAAMPTTLVCSRPFQPIGGAVSDVRGLDVGETLTVTYSQVITDAFGVELENTASVTDRGDSADNSATATSTVTANPPVAERDSDTGNTIGESVTVDVVDNDDAGTGALVPGLVRILNGITPVTELVVDGEGTWTVNTTTGAITFEPEPGFEGNPTVITYRITDVNGLTDEATVTVTYLPVAVDDVRRNLEVGSTVDVPVLGNDEGVFDPTTVVILDGGNPVTELVVVGEGTWSVQPGGVIRFVPVAGFESDPEPITYRVTGQGPVPVTSLVTVDYLQAAADDEDLDNTIGESVDVPVLPNDTGDFDDRTLRLLDANGDEVTRLVVDGEGVWTVEAGGIIRFVPVTGFLTDPTAVDYVVADVRGDVVGATVTVTYVPTAVDDERLRNPLGATIALDPTANDLGDFDATTVSLIDANGDRVRSLVVAGEGAWQVDPVSGMITFEPEASFVGNPTPVQYEVADVTGDVVGAQIVITYLPEAENDSSLRNQPGTPVTLDPIGNDSGVFDPTSVYLIDADGNRVRTLRVAGQGTWTVNETTGAITFTPGRGFFGNPAPVRYLVTDTLRGEVEATVTITYLPTATNDVSNGNTPGAPVTLDVVGNDDGDLIPSSVVLIDADGNRVTTLRVPGEGTWTVNTTTGAITFTPEEGFRGNPTPVNYEVTDIYGEVTEAQAIVTYTMPVTGAESLPVALGGAAALLLGAVLLMVRRRFTSTGRHAA